MGCARMLHQAVLYSLNPRDLNINDGKSTNERIINIEWALGGNLLLEHFCDIYNLDYKKVAKAIILKNLQGLDKFNYRIYYELKNRAISSGILNQRSGQG